MKQARESFNFHTRLNLLELTGVNARNIKELVEYIKIAPEGVIYHHTHHFLQQHIYLSPEPPNDFAYWVKEILGDDLLAEKLASIDVSDFHNMATLRNKITASIENYLQQNNSSLSDVASGREFHFIKTITFVLPTPYVAYNLKEFLAILKKITVHSFYYHIFEARLRLKRPTNDFSNWLLTSLDETELAKQIEKIDPYTYTLESLRQKICRLIEKRLTGQ